MLDGGVVSGVLSGVLSVAGGAARAIPRGDRGGDAGGDAGAPGDEVRLGDAVAPSSSSSPASPALQIDLLLHQLHVFQRRGGDVRLAARVRVVRPPRRRRFPAPRL